MNFSSQITSQENAHTCPSSLPQVRQSIRQYLFNMGQRAIAYLTQNFEPKITHRIHTGGTSTWRIYDPDSGQSIVCHSVVEVQEWLEARYSFRGPY